MKMQTRRLGAMALVLMMGVFALFPMAALAAGNVTINTNVDHHVYGNGDDANNGDLPTPSDISSLSTPSNNTVTIKSGFTVGPSPNRSVYGGYTSTTANANDNQVTIESGATVGPNDGRVYGGYVNNNTATADGNRVTIESNATVAGSVSGGYVDSGGSGSADRNQVTINGGSVGTVVYGGYAASGSASDNRVTINGGSVGTVVYGGFAGGSGSANNNTVTINGGTLNTVYGGRGSGSGSATGNTVNFSSGTINGNIIGGEGNTVSGNTLNVNADNLSVGGVQNFANINFYLPSSAPTSAMLTATTQVDLSGVTVGIGFSAAPPPLQVNDTITLIENVNPSNHPANSTTPIIASNYTFELSLRGSALIATVMVSPYIPPPPSTGFSVTISPRKATAPKTAFPVSATLTGKRANVYALATLRGKTLYRLNKGDTFTLLGIAPGGKALRMEKDYQEGYIGIKDLLAEFGTPIKAAATAKKAGAFTLNENGKYKRIGYYEKGQVLWIHGIEGKYLVNKQINATYRLDAAQWSLSVE